MKKETKIEILSSPEAIKEVEISLNTKTGVMYQDKYVTLVKDAVRFANGTLGTYIRFIESDASKRGCVVLPVLENGSIVLVKHWRHATQSYLYEIPRGFGHPDLNAIENAEKEIKEEIGVGINEIVFLGNVHPDSGLFEKEVSMFMVKIENETFTCFDESEAIEDIVCCTISDIQAMIKNGELKDSFTLTAISMAFLSGEILI